MFWITLSRQVLGKYSLSIWGSSLALSFPAEVFKWHDLGLPSLSFTDHPFFPSCLRSHSLTQGRLHALLSSRNDIILWFTPDLQSILHLCLGKVFDLVQVHFPAGGCPAVPAPFTDKTDFILLHSPGF